MVLGGGESFDLYILFSWGERNYADGGEEYWGREGKEIEEKRERTITKKMKS